ncbi:MAG: aminoglycoside phosphotransferase family protein [bacterium]
MIELNIENLNKYLKYQLKNVFPKSKKVTILKTEEIKEQTYVNYIFKVQIEIEGKKRTIYLRQTRDHVKTRPDRKLNPSRIQFETKILKLLNSIQAEVVPEVLFLDTDNNVAFLSDIKKSGKLLVNELIKGDPHTETADNFGKIIGIFHRETMGIGHDLIHGNASKNDAAIKFHLGMRLEPALTMFFKETRRLLKESEKTKKCLVLGDLASKNIFVDKEKVRFLDLERAFIGDPAFDVALLFCHYLIEVTPENLSKSIAFVKRFMRSYLENLAERYSQIEKTRLENRIIRFLGVTILYRLFGFYLVINLERNKVYWLKIAENLLKSKTGFFDSIDSIIR